MEKKMSVEDLVMSRTPVSGRTNSGTGIVVRIPSEVIPNFIQLDPDKISGLSIADGLIEAGMSFEGLMGQGVKPSHFKKYRDQASKTELGGQIRYFDQFIKSIPSSGYQPKNW